MKLSGVLTIDGKTYKTLIDELVALGDLGNGTCGHVVKMKHRESGKIIACKQMRRTGNSEETKRIVGTQRRGQQERQKACGLGHVVEALFTSVPP